MRITSWAIFFSKTAHKAPFSKRFAAFFKVFQKRNKFDFGDRFLETFENIFDFSSKIKFVKNEPSESFRKRVKRVFEVVKKLMGG